MEPLWSIQSSGRVGVTTKRGEDDEGCVRRAMLDGGLVEGCVSWQGWAAFCACLFGGPTNTFVCSDMERRRPG